MIYADFNGSAPICPEVKDYLIKRLEEGPFANPNAIHYLGAKTLMGMEKARKICGEILGADKTQVIFNSGATEGISTIFHSFLHPAQVKGRTKIIISGIEHSAIHNTANSYIERGFSVHILKTHPNGIVDIEELESLIAHEAQNIAMVAVMAANNETGIIQPFEEISTLCKKNNIKYFCDTTQYFGKIEFNFSESSLDYAVLSGHKIGALPGTGIMLAKDPNSIIPLIIGGGQENNLRGGTQNYIGNETLAVALTAFSEKKEKLETINSKRVEFENKIKELHPEVVIIGQNSARLAGTTYIAYPGIHGQAVQIELESQNIFVTTSSACSDNAPVTSRVLKSLGVSDEVGRAVVRITLSCCSPLENYDKILDALDRSYNRLKKIQGY